MQRLIQCLGELQSKLERYHKLAVNEATTRKAFIDPTLQALGWDLLDPDEVGLEHPTVGGKTIDYALKLNGKLVLLVEAKPLSDPLDAKALTQIIGYAANAGIDWCILTNGVRWQVFSSAEKCEAPRKLMFEVSIDPKDNKGADLQTIAEQMWRFGRGEMAKGTLDAIGEQVFTDGKVRKILERLFRDPPRKLLNLVREALGDQRLEPRRIGASLRRIGVVTFGRELPEQPGGRLGQRRSAEAAAPLAAGRPAAQIRAPRGQFDERHHTNGIPREVAELYRAVDRFCAGLASGGEVSKRYRSDCIGYSVVKHTFCSVRLYKRSLRVYLPLEYRRIPNAPAFARDVSNVRHWGVGDTELAISSTDQLDAAQELIKMAFDHVRAG